MRHPQFTLSEAATVAAAARLSGFVCFVFEKDVYCFNFVIIMNKHSQRMGQF